VKSQQGLFSCPRIFCPRKARKNTKGRAVFFSVSFVFSVDPLFLILRGLERGNRIHVNSWFLIRLIRRPVPLLSWLRVIFDKGRHNDPSADYPTSGQKPSSRIASAVQGQTAGKLRSSIPVSRSARALADSYDSGISSAGSGCNPGFCCSRRVALRRCSLIVPV